MDVLDTPTSSKFGFRTFKNIDRRPSIRIRRGKWKKGMAGWGRSVCFDWIGEPDNLATWQPYYKRSPPLPLHDSKGTGLLALKSPKSPWFSSFIFDPTETPPTETPRHWRRQTSSTMTCTSGRCRGPCSRRGARWRRANPVRDEGGRAG